MSNDVEIRNIGNQAVIGGIPSWLTKWGNLIILIVLSILLYILLHITFPIIVQGEVLITDEGVYVVLPVAKLNRIDIAQDVGLRIDDYPYMNYGILHGKIDLNQLTWKENVAHIPVILQNDRNAIKQSDLQPGMRGSGDIIVEKAPLIYRIIRTK